MHYLLLPYSMVALLFVWFYDRRSNQAALAGIMLMCLIMIFMIWGAIVFRPIAGDPFRYMLGFDDLRRLSLIQMLSVDNPEFLFRWLNWFIGQLSISNVVFFSCTFAIFIVPFWLACRSYFTSVHSAALLMAYSMYPYFIAYAASGIRQGIGLSFMLLALVLLSKKSKWGWAWLFLSPLWHNGMWLAIIVVGGIFLIPKSLNRLHICLLVLSLSVVLSITGINESITSFIPGLIDLDSNKDIYFDKDAADSINYRTGFRGDFFLFSMFPLVIYLFIKRKFINREQPELWVSIYAGLNSIYHFFSFAIFTDRFASFSWFIMPFVLLVMVVNGNHINAHIKMFVMIFCSVNIFLLQFYTGTYLTELILN